MVTQPAVTDAQILDLLPGCQRGDMTAVEGMYGLYAGRLYRYMLARVGDSETAADLAGETFVRVIANLARFRLSPSCPAASFSGWVYRIAGNLVADHARRSGRLPTAGLDDEYSPSAREPEPLHLVEQRESIAQLALALEKLTEEQRLVVIGKFAEGMTNPEIAAWLGKSEGAVKSLQHRALHALGQLLRREAG